MLKRALSVALIAASLGLAGCAVSPQKLSLQPVLSADLQAVGQGQPVSVKVVDARASESLGSLGGLYAQSSTVTVEREQLVSSLRAQVETAVRLLGFTPTSNGFNAPELVVTVESLEYRLPEGGYATSADIAARLRADARNASRNYSGRYASTLTQRFAMTPNQQTNEQLVSGVVSDALGRAFRDAEIGRVLAGQ